MSVNIQTSSGLVKIAGTPTIDTTLSNVSKNPVQNKVVTAKIDEINRNLDIQGLLDKFDGKLNQAYYDVNNGTKAVHSDFVCNTNPISCNSGDSINFKLGIKPNNGLQIIYFNESGYVSGVTKYGTDLTFTAPSGATYFHFNYARSGGVTPTSAGSISVFINNEIEEINESLDNLSKGGINLACNFIQGGVSGNVGSQYITNNTSNRCRTDKKYLSDITSIIPLSIPSSYRVGITSYNSSDVMIDDSGWLTGTVDYERVENTSYITIVVSKTDNTDITPQVAEQLGIKALVYNFGEEIDNIKNDLGGLSFSVNGSTLTITNGTKTWTLT